MRFVRKDLVTLDMQISVHGKQLDIDDGVRAHVERRLTAGVAKYFDRAIEADVTLSRETHQFHAECVVHVGSGINVRSHRVATELHADINAAAERMEKRLRRFKRRLRNHHKRAPIHHISAQSYVIAAEPDEATGGDEALEPVIVARSTTEILTLTLSEVVMRMTLADLQMMVFRTSADRGLNVLHRRPDGTIEWIEPDGPHRNSQGIPHGDR